MSPERMLLYVTDASPCCDSTSAGFPESMEQVPRATPGLEAGSVVGSLESSQTWQWGGAMSMAMAIAMAIWKQRCTTLLNTM